MAAHHPNRMLVAHRQRRQFGGLFGGGNSNANADSPNAAPNVDPGTTKAAVPNPPVTTPSSNQPTAGPIIQFPGGGGNGGDSTPTTPAPAPQQPATTPAQQQQPPPPPPPAPVTTAQTTPPAPVVPTTQAAPTTTPTIATPVVPTTPLTTPTLASPTFNSAIQSASASSTPSGGSHVGPIIGGVAAGLAGVVIIVFAITYFIRKKQSKQYDQDHFDAAQFRRSAVLMDDPPTHDDVMARGFNGAGAPPPLDMSQQHGYGGYPAPVSYNNLGHGSHVDADMPPNSAGFGAAGTSRWSELSPPPTAASAAPFIPGGANGYNGGHPSPMPSPISPTTVSPYESVYNQTGLGREPSMGSASVLSRQPSAGAFQAYPNVGVAVTRDPSIRDIHNNPVASPPPPIDAEAAQAQYAHFPVLNQSSPRHSVPMPQNDYIDMTRSSVTPFQAAQYAAISHKLNAAVPKGLDTPIVEEHIQRMSPPPLPLSNEPMPSPFDDPVVPNNGHTKQGSGGSFRAPPPPPALIPGDASASLAPPEPARVSPRITSTPPMLPEINVPGRITSMDMSKGASPATPSPMASSFIVDAPVNGGGGYGGHQMFPATPSAIHESFSPVPEQAGKSFGQQQQQQQGRQQHGQGQEKRPETVYDPEDAYGGM